MLELGCCGAYCKTCQGLLSGNCKGCKIGYGPGGRDLSRARCEIKRCAMGRGYVSCADCADFLSCGILPGFYAKNGDKYRRYHRQLDFVISCGYGAFFAAADGWKNAYGPLDDLKKRK